MKPGKQKALNNFARELRKHFKDKIWGIYLFGSSAKGSDTPQSDMDVLVVYSDLDEWDLLEVASKIGFKIVCEQGESVEVVSMSKEEYERSVGRSPFLWEVLKFGKPIFSRIGGTEWELDFKDYLELAEEFLKFAKDALGENKLRLAIDTGYNAAELLAKSLIISTRNSLASSHGGIVGQFGRLFVLTDQLDAQLGRELNLGLELRAKARYMPKAQLNQKEAALVINLTEKLLKIAHERLLGGAG